MKNYLYENYDILIDKIYIKNNINFFFINNDKVLLYCYKDNIEKIDKLINLTNDLYNKKINTHTFILNKEKNYYSKRNKDNIFLLKVNNINEKITLNYLKKYNNIECDLDIFDIKKNMENEIDEIEKMVSELNDEYKLIQESINYFIGMSENAIELLDGLKIESNTLAHNIFIDNYNSESFENPLNYIKCNKAFDYANYIKYKFYKNEIDYEEIYQILEELQEEEQILLFSLLMYQKNYFNAVKMVLNDEMEENNLKRYISNIKKYKNLLIYCQKNIKKSKIVKLITWICE